MLPPVAPPRSPDSSPLRVRRRTHRDGLIIGAALIVVGLGAMAMTYADLDPSAWLGGSGWTLFVIVPGVLLLASGLLTDRPAALGLTIAGSIVTTIGLLLLAMDQTDRWDAWAYAWALIPAARGSASCCTASKPRIVPSSLPAFAWAQSRSASSPSGGGSSRRCSGPASRRSTWETAGRSW